MNTKTLTLIAGLAACASSRLFAGTITFEQSKPGQDIGSFYQGVTFAPGVITVQQEPLLGFPAHSGVQQATVSDTSSTPGILSFTFAAPQTALSFWFNTQYGITVNLYAANGSLISATDLDNTTGTGGANALFNPTLGTSVKSVTIDDDYFAGILSGFFTIDDLSAPGINGLPSPDASSTLALLGFATAGLLTFRRKFAKR